MLKIIAAAKQRLTAAIASNLRLYYAKEADVKCDSSAIKAIHQLIVMTPVMLSICLRFFCVVWVVIITLTVHVHLLLLCPRERLRSIVMKTSVCVSVSVSVCSVCEDISGTTRTIFTKFVGMCLWLWLGPPPASLRYVMCFRLCGWHHVFLWWAV